MECQIGVISGDGIGPEIVTEAKKVLDQIGKKYGHSFQYTDILMGLILMLIAVECFGGGMRPILIDIIRGSRL